MAVNTTAASGAAAAPQQNYQYLRNFSLIISDSNFNGIDLSALHCKFSIKRSSNMTPNCADIRVYNLDLNTVSSHKTAVHKSGDSRWV